MPDRSPVRGVDGLPRPPRGSLEKAPPQASALPSRWGVGLAAAGCFVLAAGLYVLRPEEALWRAGALRVGLVMGALWLALPSRDRAAAWAAWDWKAVGFVALCGALSVRAPQLGLPLLAGWWFWRWLKAVPPIIPPEVD